jgi:hypothetical protein
MAHPARPAVDGKFRCTRYDTWKPFDDFYRRSSRASGRLSLCKPCQREERKRYPRRNDQAEWRLRKLKEDPMFDRRGWLRNAYGITLEGFEAMLESQGGACAICAGPPMGKGTYHVDHCHKTGEIRGLLCHKCNVALGMVQDSVEHLERLIAYLRPEIA